MTQLPGIHTHEDTRFVIGWHTTHEEYDDVTEIACRGYLQHRDKPTTTSTTLNLHLEDDCKVQASDSCGGLALSFGEACGDVTLFMSAELEQATYELLASRQREKVNA
jgi:hypothetical protein